MAECKDIQTEIQTGCVVKGKRLILQPIKHGDEEQLAKLATNPNIFRFTSDRFPHPFTCKVAKSCIQLSEMSIV